MDYNTILISYIVYTGTYLFLLFTIMKGNKILKKDLQYSYIYFSIILFITALSFIDETNKNIIESVIGMATFLLTFNLIIFFRHKKQKSPNILKTTYLKGKKIVYITISLISIICLLALLFNNGFKEYIMWTILLIVISIVSLTWNIIYFCDQKKKNISSEIVMLYNEKSYVQYDVTSKVIINLHKIIGKEATILKDRSFMIYLTENRINTLLWTFYVEGINIDKNDTFDFDFFEIFNKIDGTYVNINRDNNTIDII